MAMFNGTHWVSDFVQERGFYPAQIYRDQNIPYTLYRYGDNTTSEQNATATQKGKIKIVWPIPSNNRGSEFNNQEEILSHVGGGSTGQYMIGRSGMWHGGIHITEATTPWCALSGKSPLEALDFPVAFKGEQAIRCMADGEIVAYRVCKDYLTLGWESGPLSFSGSFVLVKHFIQPGEKESSGLHFYTLYMHLAPYSAYSVNPAEKKWTVQDTLTAYDPEWVMTASTNNKSISESYRKGTIPKGSIVEWDKTDSGLHTVAFNKREYGLVTFVSLSEQALKKGKKTSLNPGQQYWMLVDKNNLSPGTDGVVQPSWWQKLMPPAKEAMKFDQVVCPTPFAISAGDPIGHMGYYQAPKDGGYEARYQVHIECTSMDDNLETFLTNPEQAGEKNPLWLKYAPGLTLYKKDVATGTFTVDTRATTRAGILPLSQVQTEVDKSTKQEYWQLRPENAYVPKGQAEPQLLSQYDLAKLGFRTETAEPASFDYLDGKNQPTGFFRNLIDSLYQTATNDPRTSHALVKHNYQRLLDKIDSGSDRYSPMEYWRALHNPDYRDVIQKTIVKHPSDWYFKKGDAIWQPFLNALKKDAPEWKKYSEDFIDKMAWMQDVTAEKLGPSLWHMHPLRFLGSLKDQNLEKIAWGAKVSKEFKLKVIEVCERLEINPDYLMSCMAFETGETFSPSVRNPNGSATGLIQFMSNTARSLGTTTNELADMTSVEQMDYVEKYFKPYAGKIKTIEDVYMVIFCPRAVGKPDSYILYDEGRSYNDNKGLDLNKDNAITKYEAGFKVREKLKLGMKEGYRG
ncbi:lytic transglycosylase domain-containing protein [Klebsiella variicola]|uniref:lytic transglycosylase domain-containing protein n=1 Tax=Klebsiella variicola TaxID=244366 RepID=UPI001D02A3CA|nr:lytic transglycosylase domain-containing protein [Klebsiella variicola]MCE0129745.1 lytic transglycosylase domain-containing protein [Klebsiella variicola subsp. variicola]MDK6225379.1 lytic transglycosylase domain-containing protein [Klebsiella variicola]MEA5492198.1 lytic transglycosylase domain-containing protein [Klebsiella variicola]UHD28901.1 lytic transglycosylase domain-containing protein [Klebsiella variicola subsp. variicola]